MMNAKGMARRPRVAVVEGESTYALGLCDWIVRFGYEPMWVRGVDELRVQWSMLAPDAVVLGPSFDYAAPPCRQLGAVCPGVPVLMVSAELTENVGPMLQTCRRASCSSLSDPAMSSAHGCTGG